MTQPVYDVLCVGILVADTFVAPLPRLPLAGELLPVSEMLLQTGGCAANTAVDLTVLGVRAAVVGKVGHDLYADYIRADLADKGVNVSGIRTARSAPTSQTVILPVVGEDRRYVHCVGANAELAPEDVPLEAVSSARVLYVGGYPLFPGFDAASLAGFFRWARDAGVRTVLDVAGVSAEEGLAPYERVLPHTDVFLPNNDEARLITGEVEPRRQAEALSALGAQMVVITLGERGWVARTQEEMLSAPAYSVKVVDPSGAGDAFDAGFIVGLLEGWDLRRTLAFASAVGACACTRLGCTTGLRSREETLSFLDEHPLDIVAEPLQA